MTDTESLDAEEFFEYSLLCFLDRLRAIASGVAEGSPFCYFIAQEYLWKLDTADGPWLLSTTAGYLSAFERAAIHRFIGCIAPVRNIVTALQYRHGNPHGLTGASSPRLLNGTSYRRAPLHCSINCTPAFSATRNTSSVLGDLAFN